MIRRALVLLLAAAAALVPVACGNGGGVSTQGIGSGGTGGGKSVAIGSISGFGSVIVNGVKYDDTAALVTINGVPNRLVSDLKLGMVVEVHGTIDSGGSTGKATDIIASLAVQGSADAVNAAANSIWVLGQRVRVDAGTVFDGFDKLDSLATGDVLAVSGLRDASAGAIAATRVERLPATDKSMVEVQGIVSGLTSSAFHLDELTVSYSAAQVSNAPMGGLANGLLVTVRGTVQADATVAATSVSVVSTDVPSGTEVEVAGFVSGFISPARFNVGSLVVDATNAAFTGGTAGTLANGTRLEVEGTVVNGVLAAKEVDFVSAGTDVAAEVEGAITGFISQANFQVRGQSIDASHAAFTGGTGSDLANGRIVHATGIVSGNVLLASSIVFEDTAPPEATHLVADGLITSFVSPASFLVNGQAVSTDTATSYTGGGVRDLANGRRVTAEGVVTNGVLVAATIAFYPVNVPPTVSTSGRISSFVSAGSFVVNGQAIAAGAGTTYVNGSESQLANGVSVTVIGTLVNGVLHATQVQFQSEGEVEGYITNFVSISNFKVQGQVVDASAASILGGTASQLANGLKVQASGPVSGGVLRATVVEIDD